MVDYKLPTYGVNKQTGNIAADILKASLQRFAIINPHEESIDLGIDMRGQIVENGVPKNQFFNIQCKGTASLDIESTDDYFTKQISVTTINYWNQQNDTTFLFIVDNATENCYWCNPIIDLNDRMSEIQGQETVNIKIPKTNLINKQTTELPTEFIQSILLYVANNLNIATSLVKRLSSALENNESLDLDFSIQLLQNIIPSIEEIHGHYKTIIEHLTQEIKDSWSESKEYLMKLIHNLPARNWVSNFQTDTGFILSGKNYNDLKQEVNSIIIEFELNKLTVSRLEDLKEIYSELLEYQINLLAFLYEMSCEDNPSGDYTKLTNGLDKLRDKKEKIITKPLLDTSPESYYK
ncbi:DUF4365 domain-containing protein [Bacillus subtilis]|uniref:DUF4365 domain-containing protein n=1 Tax=Bacillus subtilis TaxID=1423 RepID=UPI0024C1C0DC|nr:DUF4365 domain-containing protein [Bacillus subtilis]WHY09510.1 DUF4365 domain-containing protein [Bacillus subtilis]WPP25583.1 DUF4365 domain-containing protein [Bacillus subtilis]